MNHPLVSVVVPIYKVEQYLERCLDSIVAQYYRPLEVILVNDGSPDGCGDIIRRYEAQWPFIQSIWQENQGLGAARNVGIRTATGKYLVLIDSDDYVEPDFISSLVHVTEHEQTDVAVCSFYFDFPNGIRIPFPLLTLQKSMPGDEAAQMSLKMLKIPSFAWNKLYRLDLFTDNAISFPSIYYEDVATVSRLLSRAGSVSIVNRPFYHYCLRRSGITGNFGSKNVMDYLKAIGIIRQFIWEEGLWDSWRKPFRSYLYSAEALLILEIVLQKNSMPLMERQRLIRFMHHRIRILGFPPGGHSHQRNKLISKVEER